MKNKHFFLLVSIMLFFSSSLCAQSGNPFDYIRADSMEQSTDPAGYFINTLRAHTNEQDTTESSANKAAMRSLAYWMGRLPRETAEPFQKYAQAMTHQPVASCPLPPGTFNGNWANIGPEMNTVSQGNVHAIYVPDGQSQEIFIGFEAGGLWHTTNGGTTWTCISDGFLSNGTIGLTDIVADPNDSVNLSLSTHIGAASARNFTAWHYGQGIWHSTDAGLTWTQDPSFSATGLMLDLEYSHDLIGGTDRMLWGFDDSQTQAVFSKIGTAAVTNITNQLISFGFPDTTEVVDIDFADDIAGRAYISTKDTWVYYPVPDTAYVHHTVGIWAVDYNVANGNITAVNNIFNAANVVPYTATLTDSVYDLRTTYIGNGEVYSVMHDGGWVFGRAVVMHYDGSNWQLVANNIHGGNIPFCTHSMMEIQSSREDPNTIYLGLTLPIRITKTGSSWNPIEVFHAYIGQASPNFHVDIRNIFLQKNGTGPDQVYWGHDGGINSGTSTQTYANVPTREVYTTLSYELDVSNNGNKRAIATFHNGLIHTEIGGAEPWAATLSGDMFGVFYDHRTDNDDQETMYNQDGFWRNRNHSNTTVIPSTQANYYSPRKAGTATWQEPQRGYQYPQDFDTDNDLMYVANKNLWRTTVHPSNPNHWFEDTRSGDLLDDEPPIKDIARATRLAPSNTETKYLVQRKLNGAHKELLYGRHHTKNNNFWKHIPTITASPTPIPGNANILDVEVDDRDDERIFICLGGVNHAGPPGIDKVFTTSNPFPLPGSTPTWFDMSAGLPIVPVTSLLYQRGSDDILYAATDVGVYRWHKPDSCWVEFNAGPNGTHMPHTVITDMDIDYCAQKLVVTTWGRGVWETDLFEPGGTTTIIPANTTVTWNASRYPKGDITIQAGATLNITGNYIAADDAYSTVIHMPHNATIHVEKGAKLLIDSARLTNSCDVTWNGIHLAGDATASQVYNMGNDNYPDHGYCEVLNGRIEHAESALNNFEHGGTAFQSGGGVMQIVDCEFINNRRAAQFWPYLNHNPAVQYPYVLKDESYFQNCTFTFDDGMRQFVNESQITMWGTAGVQIQGCAFEQQMVSKPGGKYAIGTADASYYLGSLNNQPSLVKGFSKGVVSGGFYKGNPHALPIFIEDTDFDGNTEGLNTQNTDWAFVRNNDFKIGSIPINTPVSSSSTPSMYAGHGTSMSHSEYVKFCGNDFEKTYSSPFAAQNFYEYTWGSLFRSVGSNPLLNTYKDLHRGTQIGGTGIPQFFCNTNTDNIDYDYYSYAPPNSFTKPSANTYSIPGNTRHWYQLVGPNIPMRIYGNPGNGSLPDFNRSLNVAPINAPLVDCNNSPTIHCNDAALIRVLYDFNTTSNANIVAQINSLKTTYYTARQNEATLQGMLDLLIDDGDTDGTLDNIDNSTSADQMTLRAELLANSPYVSQEALRELAEQNIVSQAILMEIILANPEASMSEGFIEFLEYEIPNPITAYMANLIRTSWDTPTNRRSLEEQLEKIQQEIYATHAEILRIYKFDLLPNSTDSFNAWVDKVPSLPEQYNKIERLLAQAQYTTAQSLLHSLPQSFEMTDEELMNHTDYVNLFAVKLGILQSGNALNALSETQKTALTQIADGSQATFARDMARGVLCFFYNTCYPTGGVITQESSNKTILPQQRLERVQKVLKVFPNPAKDHVTFQLMNQEEACKDCSIIVTDLQGRRVYEAELNKLSGMHIWDTRNVSAGAYIYQVKTNTAVESGKVIITK